MRFRGRGAEKGGGGLEWSQAAAAVGRQFLAVTNRLKQRRLAEHSFVCPVFRILHRGMTNTEAPKSLPLIPDTLPI